MPRSSFNPWRDNPRDFGGTNAWETPRLSRDQARQLAEWLASQDVAPASYGNISYRGSSGVRQSDVNQAAEALYGSPGWDEPGGTGISVEPQDYVGMDTSMPASQSWTHGRKQNTNAGSKICDKN
jgi:hypothetical protein